MELSTYKNNQCSTGESAPLIKITLSPKITITHINKLAEEIFSCNLKEVKGKNFINFCKMQHFNFPDKKLLLFIKTQEKIAGSWRLCLKGGIQYILRYEFIPTFDEHSILSYVEIVAYITMRVFPPLVNGVNNSEYLYNIINNVPFCIFWKNKDLKFLGCNQSFASLLGLRTPEDILYKTDYDVRCPWTKKEAKKYRRDDKDIIETCTPKLCYEEIQTQHDRTQRIKLVSKVPTYDKSGNCTGILGVYADITQQKIIEKELRVAKRKLKMLSDSRSQLIQSMQHDIRAPLSGIYSVTSALAAKEKVVEKKSSLLAVAKSSLQLIDYLGEAMNLINAKDIFAQDEAGDQPFSIRTLVEEIALIEKISLECKGINFVKVVGKSLPEMVIGNKFAVKQILLNLVSNAIKFTQSGSVEINIDVVTSTSDNLFIVFLVKDTGVGISEANRKLIFERIFQVDVNSFGQGLGLSIVKSHVEALNGTISFTSAVNRGTSFKVKLPFRRFSDTSLQKIEKSAGQVNPQIDKLIGKQPSTLTRLINKTVLIVDDDALSRKAAFFMLEQYNFQSVDFASSSIDAIRKSLKKNYDFIFIDINLPDIDGVITGGFLSTVYQSKTHQPVIIVLTADVRKLEQAKKINSAMHFITKPLTKKQLETIFYKASMHAPKTFVEV